MTFDPRFIDVCGLPNENNDVTRELWRHLLYGAIPVDKNVLEVHALGDREGAAAMRAKYPHINTNWPLTGGPLSNKGFSRPRHLEGKECNHLLSRTSLGISSL